MARKPNSSSAITGSGHKAQKTGCNLEEFVENALVSRGYVLFEGNKALAFGNRRALGGKQYLKQVPAGMNIYDTLRKVDFLVINEHKFGDGLIIECKWQQVGGSADEKYPLLVFNIIKTAVPTVVLLDGEGYRAAAGDWLKSQANPRAALIAVWDMREFQRQVNNGFFD